MEAADAVAGSVRERLASWPGHRVVEALLDRHPGVECFVAGGIVRDVLLGREPSFGDVDLFLDGDGVDALLADLGAHGALRTGPFGSPRWLPEGAQGYADIIPIRRFDNGLWPCEDMTDALNQFDFTCNAVAVDLRSRELLDPQNGRRDAARRVMRAVRFDFPPEPIARGAELLRPAVLWFRLLHYAAAKGLAIEPLTLAWLRAQRGYLELEPLYAETFAPLHPRALDPLRDARP